MCSKTSGAGAETSGGGGTGAGRGAGVDATCAREGLGLRFFSFSWGGYVFPDTYKNLDPLSQIKR